MSTGPKLVQVTRTVPAHAASKSSVLCTSIVGHVCYPQLLNSSHYISDSSHAMNTWEKNFYVVDHGVEVTWADEVCTDSYHVEPHSALWRSKVTTPQASNTHVSSTNPVPVVK